MPFTVDPRLNCAAEICCTANDARLAGIELLREAGVVNPEETADQMRAKGLVLMPAALAQIIAEIADHPGRKS
jgi:hypothetical protein